MFVNTSYILFFLFGEKTAYLFLQLRDQNACFCPIVIVHVISRVSVFFLNYLRFWFVACFHISFNASSRMHPEKSSGARKLVAFSRSSRLAASSISPTEQT